MIDRYRVPIYSLSSWSSIVSLKAAMFVDPIRDVYEVQLGSRYTRQNTKIPRLLLSIPSSSF
jgi:hypothetical protein